MSFVKQDVIKYICQSVLTHPQQQPLDGTVPQTRPKMGINWIGIWAGLHTERFSLCVCYVDSGLHWWKPFLCSLRMPVAMSQACQCCYYYYYSLSLYLSICSWNTIPLQIAWKKLCSPMCLCEERAPPGTNLIQELIICTVHQSFLSEAS